MAKSLSGKKKALGTCERMTLHEYGVNPAPERHGRQLSGLCISEILLPRGVFSAKPVAELLQRRLLLGPPAAAA